MKKIGIFGGTFNPIHLGHTHLAAAYQERFCFDKILLIPTKLPPHKQVSDLADDTARLDMCRLAVRDLPYIEVSEIELKREGKSYTYDTLSALQTQYPDAAFYLIMGSDMFLTFRQWYRADEMLHMATLLTAPRKEGELALLKAEQKRLETAGGTAVIADIPVLEVSSTELRERFREGHYDGPMDLAVLDYLKKKKIYQKAFPFSEEEILPFLKERLSPERFLHSVNVAKQAEHLAVRFHFDSQKAKMTGLLHDICKNDNLDIQLQIIADGGIILSDIERKSPPLYHAIAGAAYLKKEFGIADNDVLHAVRYHTTGRAGMSLLEKIVYLADLTSEERRYSDVELMRRLAEQDMDAAILYASSYLITDLVRRGRYLHPDSVAAYHEMCKITGDGISHGIKKLEELENHVCDPNQKEKEENENQR